MKVIFPNVRSEMAKKGMIYKDLKENGMGMSISSISYKMTGRYEFTLSEALIRIGYEKGRRDGYAEALTEMEKGKEHGRD